MNIQKQHKKLLLLSLPILVFLVASFFVISSNSHESINQDLVASENVNYNSNVQLQLIRDGQVVWEDNGHNIIYNNGLEEIEQWAAGGVNHGPFTTIALCNNSVAACGTPVAAASEAFTNITGCDLQPAAGTYSSMGTGNASVYKTFTVNSACTNAITINSTRLINSTGGLWAGKLFTNPVTVYGNDQLTVNWTWWATSS